MPSYGGLKRYPRKTALDYFQQPPETITPPNHVMTISEHQTLAAVTERQNAKRFLTYAGNLKIPQGLRELARLLGNLATKNAQMWEGKRP